MSFSVSRKDSDDENFTFKNLEFKDNNEPKTLGLLYTTSWISKVISKICKQDVGDKLSICILNLQVF